MTGPSELFTQLSTIMCPILILSVTDITAIDYQLIRLLFFNIIQPNLL